MNILANSKCSGFSAPPSPRPAIFAFLILDLCFRFLRTVVVVVSNAKARFIRKPGPPDSRGRSSSACGVELVLRQASGFTSSAEFLLCVGCCANVHASKWIRGNTAEAHSLEVLLRAITDIGGTIGMDCYGTALIGLAEDTTKGDSLERRCSDAAAVATGTRSGPSCQVTTNRFSLT